jgi:hypothetical protein
MACARQVVANAFPQQSGVFSESSGNAQAESGRSKSEPGVILIEQKRDFCYLNAGITHK